MPTEIKTTQLMHHCLEAWPTPGGNHSSYLKLQHVLSWNVPLLLNKLEFVRNNATKVLQLLGTRPAVLNWPAQRFGWNSTKRRFLNWRNNASIDKWCIQNLKITPPHLNLLSRKRPKHLCSLFLTLFLLVRKKKPFIGVRQEIIAVNAVCHPTEDVTQTKEFSETNHSGVVSESDLRPIGEKKLELALFSQTSRDWVGLRYCLSTGTAQTGLHLAMEAKPFQPFHPELIPPVFKNKPHRTSTHSYIFRTAWTCLLGPEHITNISTSSIQCRYTNPRHSWHREEHSNRTPPEIMSLNHLRISNW